MDWTAHNSTESISDQLIIQRNTRIIVKAALMLYITSHAWRGRWHWWRHSLHVWRRRTHRRRSTLLRILRILEKMETHSIDHQMRLVEHLYK